MPVSRKRYSDDIRNEANCERVHAARVSNCSVLKQSLMEHGIPLRNTTWDSPQSRTTLLMRGVFTTVAPVLQVKDTFLTFDDLFHNDELNIDLILSLLRC